MIPTLVYLLLSPPAYVRFNHDHVHLGKVCYRSLHKGSRWILETRPVKRCGRGR